ncbi:MAG: ferredoxin-nitrite reductase [Marmoricola sp.]|nr:ferredoxin-nitrite reductase [Marmoricola sp.]
MTALRTRGDLCPGVARPWVAADGALVRLRLVGGQISLAALGKLADVSSRYGDGDIHLTTRANLQLRGLPAADGLLPAEVVDTLAATGLVPSPSHELVRNVMVSPLTGISGGRADLRPVARALDAGLCAAPLLASLPARFLFVLDDGRGDVAGRSLDLGLVALSATTAQLRFGSAWGPVVGLGEAPARLLSLAHRFLESRGDGATAAWHVAELDRPLAPGQDPDPLAPTATAPPTFADVTHLDVPAGVLTPALIDGLLGSGVDRLVVTPWHGVLLIDPSVDRSVDRSGQA